jgi:hypothetical protein
VQPLVIVALLVQGEKLRVLFGAACALVCVGCWLGALVLRPSTETARSRYVGTGLWLAGLASGGAAVMLLTG